MCDYAGQMFYNFECTNGNGNDNSDAISPWIFVFFFFFHSIEIATNQARANNIRDVQDKWLVFGYRCDFFFFTFLFSSLLFVYFLPAKAEKRKSGF